MSLQAGLADVRLGLDDERIASYAVLLPLTAAKVP